jgi:ammonium transporter, Amt family
MGFAGGVIGAYLASREPFMTMSGGLAGIISVAAGMDVYYPGLAFIIAVVGGATMPMVGKFVEKCGIDDAVGAVAVHGWCGFFGVVMVGVFASGYPSVPEGAPAISFTGQLLSAVIIVITGFVPGYVISLALKKMNLLRVPPKVEAAGLDLVEIPAIPYPERVPARDIIEGTQPANEGSLPTSAVLTS